MVATTAINKSTDWRVIQTEDNYCADDLIEAYKQGRKDGLSKQKQAIFKLLDNNVQKGVEAVETVVSELKQSKISPKAAYMRINAWNNLNILMSIPQESFLNDDFLKFYTLVGTLENNVKGDFSLMFSFTSLNENFDEDMVSAEGFVFRHEIK